MPLYNKERDVKRAIQSVLNQSFGDFELLIINDGSTDNGPEIVRRIQDNRIRLLNQSNQGVSAARNIGIQEAKADLIAFLDADDEWKENFLSTIIRLKTEYPQCSVFATSYAIEGVYKRNAVLDGLPASFTEGVLPDYFRIAAQSDPPLFTSAITVAKDAILSIQCFPVGIKSGEDLLTWARLAAKYDIAYSRTTGAVFWEPLAVSERPGRTPQFPDNVGQELLSLLKTSDPARVKGMDKYLSLWHRMRARVLIQLCENSMARSELKIAMRYSSNIRLYIIYAASFMSARLSNLFIKNISRLLNGMKNIANVV